MDEIILPKESVSPILIPCPPENFAEFISKLLGKPQTIKGIKFGVFDIGIDEIVRFYYLIEQRIGEQNKGNLVQFTASIKYNDGTSVDVNSIESLRTYAEVKPIVSTGITLTFIYVILFESRDIPEKQKIDIDIKTNSSSGQDDLPFIMVDGIIGPNIMLRSEGAPGSISYRIEHTARTWGSDIENMLRDHIDSLISSKTSFFSKTIRNYKNILLNICAISLIAFFLAVGFIAYEYFFEINSLYYKEISGKDIDKISQAIDKIDYIFNYLGGTNIFIASASVVYVCFSVIILYSWSIDLMDRSRKVRPSFLTLSRKAEVEKNKEIIRYKKSFFRFISLYFLSVISGIIGNAVFWMIIR